MQQSSSTNDAVSDGLQTPYLSLSSPLLCPTDAHPSAPSQVDGFNFDSNDVYSPVVTLVVIRILFTIFAAISDVIFHHLDISQAYLWAALDPPVYMRAFAGMEVPAGHCLKLHRALYGLRGSSTAWYRTFVKALMSAPLFYVQSSFDQCVLYKSEGLCFLILLLFVDDMLILIASYIKALVQLRQLGPTPIYSDYESAATIAESGRPAQFKSTKHPERRFFSIQQAIGMIVARMARASSLINCADIGATYKDAANFIQQRTVLMANSYGPPARPFAREHQPRRGVTIEEI